MLASPENNPLKIPEILTIIGQFIPLWGWDEDGYIKFLPHNMLPCLSVSHYFRQILLPIFWHTVEEVSMSAVPKELLQKYATHIRIIQGLDRQRQIRRLGPRTYEWSVQPFFDLSSFTFCTRLTELTRTCHFDDDAAIADIIKRNPQLRRLGANFSLKHSPEVAAFANLPHLEHAKLSGHIQSDSEAVIRKLMLAIAPTVTSLVLSSEAAFLHHDGLVFPKLKDLEVWYSSKGSAFCVLSEMFPNLETISLGFPYDHRANLYEDAAPSIFAAGAWPKRTRISLKLCGENSKAFKKLLDDHPGLEGLELRMETWPEPLRHSMKRHFGTLRSLTVGGYNKVSFVTDLLKSCTQLSHFAVKDLTESKTAIEMLLEKENWGNRDALESLSFNDNESMNIYGIMLKRPIRPLLPDGVTSETLAMDPHYGWKVHGGLLVHNLAFLKELFETVNDIFPRLRVISLNGVVYRKVVP